MSTHRGHILKSSLGVMAATLASRILGLVRVMLEARVLGGGTVASAWNLAITVPNLFRRILGEGALGSALIPILSGIEAEEGEKKVRHDLSIVFAVLSLVLLAIVVIVAGIAFLAQIFIVPKLPPEYAHVALALKLLPIVMPYAFFICLVGVAGAVLNTKRVFFLPALGALILNIMLVSTLACGYFYMENDSAKLLDWLGFAVIISGVIHLLMMIALLWRHGRMPLFKRAALKNKTMLGKLWKLMLPGVIGASATQISFIIDRSLAAWLGPDAVPALSYTERLVDLPIGVFAMALGAVLLSDLSRAAANGEKTVFKESVSLGLRHVYFTCIPLTVFIILFRHEILSLLFLGGNFTEANLEATGFAALFYCLGIPIFCAQKVIIPAFHARKEMKTPLKVALWAIAINIVLNLILMWPLRQGGIALATVISASFNNLMLIYILRKQGYAFDAKPVIITVLKVIAATIPALLTARFLYNGAMEWNLILWKKELVPLLSTAAVFTAIFTASAWTARCPEIKENISIFTRKKR